MLCDVRGVALCCGCGVGGVVLTSNFLCCTFFSLCIPFGEHNLRSKHDASKEVNQGSVASTKFALFGGE
jgi:hypothetical protein